MLAWGRQGPENLTTTISSRESIDPWQPIAQQPLTDQDSKLLMRLSAHQLFQIVRTIVNRTPGVHSCEVPVNLLCALLASLSRMPGRLHLTNFSVTRTNKENKRMAELSCERLIWLLNVQATVSFRKISTLILSTFTLQPHSGSQMRIWILAPWRKWAIVKMKPTVLKFWVGWLYLLRNLHHTRTCMATDI